MATSTIATVEGTNDPNSTKVKATIGGRLSPKITSGAQRNQAAE
jgi:hypothetical protein